MNFVMSGAVGCDGLERVMGTWTQKVAIADESRLGHCFQSMPERQEQAAASLTLQPRADVCARQSLGLSHFRRFAERVLRGNETPRFPDCHFIASGVSRRVALDQHQHVPRAC